MSESVLSSDANNLLATGEVTTPPSANSATESLEKDHSERKRKTRDNDDTESKVDKVVVVEDGHDEEEEEGELSDEAPPLPDEQIPPLPDEAPPGEAQDNNDDGWEPVWDGNAQAYYFYNRITGVSQWENPRVPEASSASGAPAPGGGREPTRAVVGGYNPAIHGDYDPTAPYAQQYEQDKQAAGIGATSTEDPSQLYTATGAFNRFTGKWQDASLTPEKFSDENKSRRQMHAYFDVDAAANSHDGRSLKAERSGRKLTKAEVKAFREKRRERKEEKRRAWLRD